MQVWLLKVFSVWLLTSIDPWDQESLLNLIGFVHQGLSLAVRLLPFEHATFIHVFMGAQLQRVLRQVDTPPLPPTLSSLSPHTSSWFCLLEKVVCDLLFIPFHLLFFSSSSPSELVLTVDTPPAVPENIGTTQVCIQFSAPFVQPFSIPAVSMVIPEPNITTITNMFSGRFSHNDIHEVCWWIP